VVYYRIGNRLPHSFAHLFVAFLTMKTGLLNVTMYTDHYRSIYFVLVVLNPRGITANDIFIAIFNCVRNKQTLDVISIFVNESKNGYTERCYVYVNFHSSKFVIFLQCTCRWVRLSGLVVIVYGYRSRGPGFQSWPYQIFWEVGDLDRGPLSSWGQLRSYLKKEVAAPV
jgi:hypothetical protein